LLVACGGSAPDDPNPDQIALEDITSAAFGDWIEAGTPGTAFTVGAGAAVGDVDGDGLPDLVLARFVSDALGTPAGSSQLLRNTTAAGGEIAFAADVEFAALTAATDAYGVALGDYDRDGDADVFLAAEGQDLLLRNDGGAFTDVTGTAGVGGADADRSSSALFVDLNDDGLLDLFVGNYHLAADRVPHPEDADRLHLNLGDGSFADVSVASGADSEGAAHAVTAADLDGDGVLDLLVANDAVPSEEDPDLRLPGDMLCVRTSVDDQGLPVYADVAEARGLIAPRLSMGIAVADFDADGDLDLYETDWGAKDLLLWDAAAAVYTEAAADFGVANRDVGGIQLIGWGALPLDLDHDGALELLVINGELRPESPQAPYQLDYYYRQPEPGAPFADISGSVGLPVALDDDDPTLPASGRGAYTGDLDGDGDLDVVLGAVAESFRVYANRTPVAGHFVRLRLTGTASAPDPVGAVVTVVTDRGRTLRRQRIAGGEPYGQSDNLIDIGLGDERPERIEVAWPSGLVQRIDTLPGFAIDRETRVTEPAWITLSARVAGASDEAPLLSITPEPGQVVAVTRSDGAPVALAEEAGTFTAALPHPGTARRTTLTITIDGAAIRLRPMLTYR
jgi:hypothetical protein